MSPFYLHTFQNDETYFRQFVIGFVGIWEEQIELDFENASLWDQIKSTGPALQVRMEIYTSSIYFYTHLN